MAFQEPCCHARYLNLKSPMNDKPAKLILDNVTIALRGRQLLSVSASVKPGEVLTVMGPSGSGKSTLLAYIGGFLDPAFAASGNIMLNGANLTAQDASERHAGILFQDPLLFPHLSVGGNLLFALPQTVKGKAVRRVRAMAALAEMGMDDCFDHDPARLSGGQKARVALARTLISEPRTLLLDEPFSKLDTQLRGEIRALVFDHARKRNLPVILVTHDPEDAVAAGGMVIRIGA